MSLSKIFTSGGIDWYYEDGWYFSKEKGQPRARIMSRDLPDPEKMFTARLNANSLKRTDPEAALLKPNPATYKLWAHKQEVERAELNS